MVWEWSWIRSSWEGLGLGMGVGTSRGLSLGGGWSWLLPLLWLGCLGLWMMGLCLLRLWWLLLLSEQVSGVVEAWGARRVVGVSGLVVWESGLVVRLPGWV